MKNIQLSLYWDNNKRNKINTFQKLVAIQLWVQARSSPSKDIQSPINIFSPTTTWSELLSIFLKQTNSPNLNRSKLIYILPTLIFFLKLNPHRSRSSNPTQIPFEPILLSLSYTRQILTPYRINTQQSVEDLYEFVQKIGEGSFAQVFKAKSILTGNLRAIKKIQKTTHPQTRTSLLNEFDILKTLDHPNVLKMYEIFEQEGFYYIVTELCMGKELFDVLLEVKCFQELEACEITFDIMSAVQLLHQQKIMHRDLKPENVMYSRNLKTLKLIDFGSAIFYQTSDIAERKRIGTSYYIAPEVLHRRYNEKCDIWSVGVMLYILLSGQPPFRGKTDADILRAVLEDQINYDRPMWKWVSSEAKALIWKMICRNVQTRYSAAEVLQDPWFKKHIPKKVFTKREETIIGKYLNNMKIYHEIGPNQIQQGILIFIINFVRDAKDQSEMMKVFKALDLNGDGVISLHQLKLGMGRYLKLGEREALYVARQIFEKVNVNNSGAIDYSQFVLSATSIQLTITEQNIDIAFDYMDTDKSGLLSVQEIREKLGENLSEETYSQLLREFDKNWNNQISRQQFRLMMKSLVRNEKYQARVTKNRK